MSESTSTAENAPAALPGGPTAEHDGWLKDTLGLDAASFATPDGGIMDSIGSAVGRLGTAIGSAAGAIKDEAVELADRTVTAGKTVLGITVVPPVASVGPAQNKRADTLLKAMPYADQKNVQAILEAAPPEAKPYLQKALASNHSAAEIEAFGKQIAGKDVKWMKENLHLVGDSNGAKGIKQQWHDSCGATTTEAMKGELDPIYALKLRTDNPDISGADKTDGTKINPDMAAEQKAILEKHGGTAVDRDKKGGAGLDTQAALNDQSGTTGLEFKSVYPTAETMDQDLNDVDKTLGDGLPVPMSIGDATGGHAVMITHVEPGPPRTYSIHDPWSGQIVDVTDKQLKDGTFNIANWNKVKRFMQPSAKD